MEMLFTKLILLCIFTVVASGGFSPANIPFKRYCSTALSDAMRLICGSRYNTMTLEYQNDESYTYPETASRSRLIGDLYPETYRVGLVHECCKRACGYTELKRYCLTSD